MRTTLRGILAIDERVVALAIARTVGDNHVDILTRKVDGRIERILREIVVHQIQKTILRHVLLTIKDNLQAEVKVCIVTHQLLDIVHIVAILTENLLINAEADKCTILLVYATLPAVGKLQTLGKSNRMCLAITHRARRKLAREHIHSLHTHTIQTYGLLEGIALVLTTRIHLAHGCRQRLERDTTTIVSHRHDIILDGNLNSVACAHNKLVNRVIDRLLNQNVDTIIRLRAITQLTDVHTGAQAQMLSRRQGFDGIVIVCHLRCVIFCVTCHI